MESGKAVQEMLMGGGAAQLQPQPLIVPMEAQYIPAPQRGQRLQG